MGTDIHIMFEVYKDGKWNAIDLDFDFYRCYDAFAILANVRNGRGFAGVKTGDGFEYISEPRGFPDDMSPEVLEWSECYDHTPSWLSLNDLQEFDWDQITKHCGYTTLECYEMWNKEGFPDSLCGGVGGSTVITLTTEQADKMLKGEMKKVESMNYYVFVEFDLSYKDSVGEYYSKLIPLMEENCPDGNPEHIRMVFYFDS